MAHMHAHTPGPSHGNNKSSGADLHVCGLLLLAGRKAEVSPWPKERLFVFLLLGGHVSHQVAGDLLDLLQVRHVFRLVLHTLRSNRSD